METLPDLLGDSPNVLSIGLNPSLPSVKAGFYFANPRNRFWKALNACDYFESPLTPSLESCEQMRDQYHIGFTDLVKRPTAGCKDLNALDYRTGSERLRELIQQLKPRMIWFHGKLTCQKYVQYGCEEKHPIDWGMQTWEIGSAPVFITPNPSPANAAFSLDVITDSYNMLFRQLAKPAAC